jgi:hypothetical protein
VFAESEPRLVKWFVARSETTRVKRASLAGRLGHRVERRRREAEASALVAACLADARRTRDAIEVAEINEAKRRRLLDASARLDRQRISMATVLIEDAFCQRWLVDAAHLAAVGEAMRHVASNARPEHPDFGVYQLLASTLQLHDGATR